MKPSPDSIQPDTSTSQEQSDLKLLNGRYRTVKLLGRGGMGAVYFAVDLGANERPVALKRVRKDKLDRRTLSTLRSEFLALATLAHPNVIRAYEFGIDYESGDLYFTSELVDGITWMKAAQRLRLATPSGFESFVDLTAQVLRGLEFIHSRGLVHSDIKPENILVASIPCGDGSEGGELQVKIIDFGLVKKEGTSGGKKILGTPYYVAPETILGAPVDRRTDLYSLGVVLYHLLTGAPPFRGASNIEILKSHVEQEPAPPHEVSDLVPLGFSEVILRLMAKKAEDRFPNALEVIEAINRALGLNLPLETQESAISYLECARLVGRESELAQVREVFSTAASIQTAARVLDDEGESSAEKAESQEPAETIAVVPQGRLVVVRGERGLQKRRFIEEFRATAQAQGAKFFELECAGTKAPGIGFERLLGELASIDELKGKVRSLAFIEKAAGFVQRLQDLRDEPVTGYEPMLDETVRALLKASQEGPIVLCVHDLHMAGRPVLRLLELLVRHSAEKAVARSKLLMLATIIDRAELEQGEVEKFCSTPFFRDNVLELELRRLGESEVSSLITRAFQGLSVDEELLHRVLEESDGNTETVIEILRHLLDHGNICRSASGWTLQGDLRHEDLPGKVRRELKERITKLPPEVLQLGRAFACLGDSCELDVAVQLSAVAPRSVFKSLEALRAERILQPGGPESRPGVYSFVHASARAILYNSIPPSELAGMHERAGVLCEGRNGAAVRGHIQNLAHHFLKAGHREKGIRYGLEAARALSREFALLPAIDLYESVLALVEREDRVLRFRVEREIAGLKFQIGDYAAVLSLLNPERLPPELKRSDKLGVYLEAGRAHARLGQFDKATTLLNRSLRTHKDQESAAELAAIMLALAELHFHKGNLVESLRCATRLQKSKCELGDPSLVSQLHLLLADNHALLSNMESAVSHCQAALRVIEAQHDSRHLAASLYCRGKYHLYKRQFRKALRQFQLCLLLRRKTCELDGQADCLKEMGSLYHLMGNQVEARTHLEQALALYGKSGNLPQAVSALCLLAEICRLLGEYDTCHEAIESALRRMEPLEKRRLTLHTLMTMAGVAIDKGEIQNARRHLEEVERMGMAGRGSNVSMMGTFPLWTELLLQSGELNAALGKAAEGVLAAREVQDPVALASITMQQAYLLCRVGRTGEARRTLVSLHDAARRHDLASLDGWARLIEGMVLSDEGKLAQAEKVFQEATEVLTTHGSARDLAYLYLEHGLLCLKRGQHEQAYLNLEEGLHLTDKLQLSYLRSRYYFAAAQLEAVIPGGQSSRAERNLQFAESVAAQAPYPEILWQIRLELGKLYLSAKRFHEAEVRLKHAVAGVAAVLKTMPQEHAQAYRRATGARDIEAMIEGCRFAGMPAMAMTALK